MDLDKNDEYLSGLRAAFEFPDLDFSINCSEDWWEGYQDGRTILLADVEAECDTEIVL